MDQTKDIFKELVNKYDYRGLAEKFAEKNFDWHADEWERFIKDIRAVALQELKAKIEGMKILYVSRYGILDNRSNEIDTYNQALSDAIKAIEEI